VVAVLGSVSVVRQPGNVSTKDGAYGTISILQQNGEPSEKNSALETFSKDYELFVLPGHDLQRGLRPHRKLKKNTV